MSVEVVLVLGLEGGFSTVYQRFYPANNLIRLEQPAGYDATQGARFRLTFDKHRGFTGEMAGDIELWFHNGVWDVTKPSRGFGGFKENRRGENSARPEAKDAFFSWFSEGQSVSQALQAWEIEDPENPVPRGTAFRWYKEWREICTMPD